MEAEIAWMQHEQEANANAGQQDGDGDGEGGGAGPGRARPEPQEGYQQARPDSGERALARSPDGRYGLERGHVGNQLEAVAGPRACG